MNEFKIDQLEERYIIGADLIYSFARNLNRHVTNEKDYVYDSRMLDRIFYPEFITIGMLRSVECKYQNEHLVPVSFLIKECMKIAINDKESKCHSEIVNHLRKYMKILKIPKKMSDYIDHDLGYKTKMPDGWMIGRDSVFSRVEYAFKSMPGYKNKKLSDEIELYDSFKSIDLY